MDNPSHNTEVVMEAGADGGSLTLYRRRTAAGDWEYQSVTDESALSEIMDPYDLGGVDLVNRGSMIASFEAAILDLDTRYRWFSLFPVEVHPEFREAVLVAVEQRMADAEYSAHNARMLEHWREVCRGERA